QKIANNKNSFVEGSYVESIQKTHTQNIALAKMVNVGGEYLANVALSKDTQIGLSNTLDGKRVDKNCKFIENSQSLLNQAYHTNKLISLNETSLARLTQKALKALNSEDSLNSQEDSRTLNSYDKLIINSQEGLEFKETQEAMKQEGLKFKDSLINSQEGSQALNKDEFLNSQEGLKALNKDENLIINSQKSSQTLNSDESLNSQRNSQTLNIDENLIINSQEGLKFTQTQEAMKQKSLKFKEAQERMRYEFFNHL
ncbi:hypothetical protein DMC01_13270, partial [Campylobacter troglodytis]